MGLIVKPNTFVPGTVIRSAEVNDNFDTIYNEFNGFIDQTNLTTLTGTVSWLLTSNVSAIVINKTAVGAGSVISITNAGTGNDITGNAGNWFVTPAGDMTVNVLTANTIVLLGDLEVNGNLKFKSGTANFLTMDHNITAPRTWFFIDTSDTFVGISSTQTLSNKTLIVPVIADFTNAQHNHQNAAGGGLLDLSLVATGVLSPANGGTGTNVVFTPGSVVFAGAGGNYDQDNANFFWDNTNNRLGLGTNTPGSILHLFSTSILGTQQRIENTTGEVSLRFIGGNGSQWQFQTAGGSQLSLLDQSSGSSIGRVNITDNLFSYRFPSSNDSSAAEFFHTGQGDSTQTVGLVTSTAWSTVPIGIGANAGIYLEARVAALNTAQSIRAYFIVQAFGRRNGGAATLDGTSTTTTIGTAGGATVDFVASGNNVELQVTGVVGQTINWEATVFAQKVDEP